MSAHRSVDFVFTKQPDGRLRFVGDFDGLYTHDQDPWDQSGQGQRLSDFYRRSRDLLNEHLKELQPTAILDVGCGLGVSTAYLDLHLSGVQVDGMDISEVAISKATLEFPDINFYCGDIGAVSPNVQLPARYDVVILNNVLWYVLHCLPNVRQNLLHLLGKDGCVVVSNAFLRDQQYGKEIIDGFDGLKQYARKHWADVFTEIRSYYEGEELGQEHQYGYLCLQRATT